MQLTPGLTDNRIKLAPKIILLHGPTLVWGQSEAAETMVIRWILVLGFYPVPGL